MILSIFKNKDEEQENLQRIVKLLDMRYAQLAIEIERLKNLGQKIDRIESKLMAIDDTISSTGIKLQQRTISVKTKDAIRMILQKYNEITPAQLSKLLKLSRTRCNEYLKQMEDEGATMSRIDSRRKFYSLRQ
jgi:biotin operon repressor